MDLLTTHCEINYEVIQNYYEVKYLQPMLKIKNKSKNLFHEMTIDFQFEYKINLDINKCEKLLKKILQENDIYSESYIDLESGKTCINYCFPYEIIKDSRLTSSEKIYMEILQGNLLKLANDENIDENIDDYILEYLNKKIENKNMILWLSKCVKFIYYQRLNGNICTKKILFSYYEKNYEKILRIENNLYNCANLEDFKEGKPASVIYDYSYESELSKKGYPINLNESVNIIQEILLKNNIVSFFGGCDKGSGITYFDADKYIFKNCSPDEINLIYELIMMVNNKIINIEDIHKKIYDQIKKMPKANYIIHTILFKIFRQKDQNGILPFTNKNGKRIKYVNSECFKFID